MPRRILVSIGTRPEAIKLAPVVHALRARASDFDVRVLATGQHRELLDEALAHFGIEPDLDLDVMRTGQSLADVTARVTSSLDSVLEAEAPDLVLGQGDTTSAFVAGLCSFYRGIPFGHVEAGLRTGDPAHPFPEEMHRRLLGPLASLHFAPTERAAAALRGEGVPEERIHVTGNPVIDALQWTAERLDPRERLVGGRRRILVTAHRRESFGAPLRSICAALRTLADRGDVDVVFPVHPNPQVREVTDAELGDLERVRLLEPLDYPAFVAELHSAHLVLTDSGGVQEEAPGLGKPVLVLRDTTERVEGLEAGTAELVGTDTTRIVAAVARLLDDPALHAERSRRVNPYGDGRAAERIVAVIARHLG